MEKGLLRRVQLEQLEILKEIHRVCVANSIPYFLDSGTLIGAVRHKGFIPWDDDIDIGMLRSDYDKFALIAPKELGNEFIWQTWHTDPNYALPFGKVRRKNTVYLEEKSGSLTNCGFYVDVFPFDNAPDDEKRMRLENVRSFWENCMLMKHRYTPWINQDSFNFKMRIKFVFYQLISLFFSHETIVNKYESNVYAVPDSNYVYLQNGYSKHYYKKEWLSKVLEGSFEGSIFYIPINTHERLSEEYGDYMKLPPENERENRHGIIKIVFSNGEEYNNV